MARAEVKLKEKPLEELVEGPETPLESPLLVTYIHPPSPKVQVGGLLGSSGIAGGIPASGFKIIGVPYNPKIIEEIDWRYAIFGKDLAPYWEWLIHNMDEKPVIKYPGEFPGSYVRSDTLGVIKGLIDNVPLFEQSPTLKSMAEALKNSLFGYEFAMTFALTKLSLDILLAVYDFIQGKKGGAIERSMYVNYSKAHLKAAVFDGILFGITYGIKEYMLWKVAQIIQSPAGTYSSSEAAVEAVKNMIYHQYFPFVNGPMSFVGNVLMFTVPLVSIGIHLYLIWRTNRKNNELIEEIRKAIK